jgi:hypothetical protein
VSLAHPPDDQRELYFLVLALIEKIAPGVNEGVVAHLLIDYEAVRIAYGI